MSKYSLPDTSTPVSGFTLVRLKSLKIQINLGASSDIRLSILDCLSEILLFDLEALVVIEFDKWAANDNSFILFSSILLLVLYKNKELISTIKAYIFESVVLVLLSIDDEPSESNNTIKMLILKIDYYERI